MGRLVLADVQAALAARIGSIERRLGGIDEAFAGVPEALRAADTRLEERLERDDVHRQVRLNGLTAVIAQIRMDVARELSAEAAARQAVLGRGLVGRLRWLLLGR